MGGHSLRATIAVNRIETYTGIRLPLRAIFVSPTPFKLAKELEAWGEGVYRPIPKAAKKEYYAMSSAQKRLFILEQMDSESTLYHMPVMIEVTGALDPARIQRAMDGLIRRHEALRTSFALIDKEAVQIIAEEAYCAVEYEEREVFPSDDMEAFLRPFDLGKAPLIRAKLIKEARRDRYLLLFDMHHIIADGMTMNILISDFSRLYDGEAPDLPELQFKDYSEWMRGADIGAQRTYWRKVFAEKAPVLDLVTDYPRPQTQSFQGAQVSARLSREQKAGIGKINKENETTVFMTLLAVWMVELHKYSRQEDIVVGVPASGRIHKDTEAMMGMFVNTLAMRSRPSGEKSFIQFLAEIKEYALGAYENQIYPFEDLVEEVETRRDMSRNPLFDVMFVVQNMESSELRLGDANLRIREINTYSAKFDLTMQVQETEEGYNLGLEYCSDLYTEASAEALLTHFLALVDAVIANPGAKIADLDMISEPEREQTLVAFNDTYTAVQAEKTIVDLFEEQVLQTPDNIALKFEGQTMTYTALNEKANRLAYRLRERGIKPDDPVVLMAERGMEMIVGILGTIKAGGAYVPVDPDYPEDRIRYMLEDSAPKAVLTYKTRPPEGSAIPVLDLLDQGAYAAETDNPSHVNSPNDLIYIIYTSGTTGKPKGAMIEHRGVVNLRKRMERDTLRQTDTVLQFASLSFDAATLELASALLFGGALCLIPNSVIQDLKAFEKYIEAHGVTMALLPPAYAAQAELKSFRRLITGGSAANRETIIRADTLGIDFTNEYGPTEVTVTASSWDYRRGAPVPLVIPIGRPIENTQIYILSGLQLCGIGVPGELCIAGAGLARGYLNQPELTAEKFIRNPFGEGRLYRSGDLARWLPDGNIEYLGRIDEQVKIRGYRIELGEIESVLRKQPGVTDAAVVTRNIGGDETLCAYFTAKQEEDPDQSMILEGLRKELPEYMLPAFMTRIPALPLNNNGKLDKQALPEPDVLARRAYTAPVTEMERVVVETFEEVLGLSPIGTEDNFFDLGGHSLRATVAVNMLEKSTGIRIPLRLLFTFPTVSMLAKELEAMGRVAYQPIPKAEEKESYAMSSAQKRLFVLDQIDGGSTAYHIPAAMEATGEADRDRIQKTMDELILRHEALRTSFALIDGEAVQRIGKAASCKVEYEEIESYSEEELEKFIRPFDLGKAPLIRLKVLQERGTNRYILLFDIHHIIADGMSMRILTEEFSRLYGGEVLKAQTLQYKDYSEWMRERDLAAQKAYWMNVFAEEAPVLDLATDYPRPQIQSYRGAQVSARLHKEQKDGIAQINKENGSTTFMTLLAAFMVMLHKYSRQNDIVVGAPIAGRMHQDTEAMMGMFVNTLAFRGYPSAEKSFVGFLAEIKDHALGAYENQEYPFERLVEDLDTRRDMSRNPLFDVMFAMQNNEKLVFHMGEAELRALEMRTGTAKFDLSLQAEETDEGFELSLEYGSDLYTEASASAMLEHFVNLIDSVIARPGAAIGELEMTSAPERERICAAFNDTYVAYPGNKTAVDLFEDQVRRTPEKTALKFEGQTMTYAALNAKANRLAYTLRERGISPESKVALITARGMEMVVGILGTIKAGGAYVPVDPGYPDERIRYMLEDSASRVVLTYRSNVPEGIDLPVLDLEAEACYADKEDNPPHVNGPEDLAYIIYTSGTTGRPKGVMIEHHGIVNMTMMYTAICAMHSSDTLLQYANMSFDETVADVFATLSCGASLCLTPADTVYDFEALHEYMREQQVTISSLTPKVIQELRIEELPSLRLLESGGEAGNIDNLKELAKKIRILNTYGPTESTVNATMTEVGPDCTLLPIGKPVINTQVYILNGMELCGIGVPGELCIAGGSLARGYLNQEELTVEKFIENPYGEGRLYRSGDLARWLPDGNIEFLGRIDEQVKLRGFRIELAEIESLLRKLPGVTDAAVIIRKAGEDAHLCAYLAAEQGRELDLAAIRAALGNDLPEYMIPAFMTQMGALPLNRSGKLDHRALPEPDALAGRSYTAPRTETERSVIAAFEEILGISPIGIEDSFFEIGGDSIKLIRVVSHLRERGYHFTVSDFMRLRTVERICEHYRYADKAVAWVPPQRNGTAPRLGVKDEKMVNEMVRLLREYGNNYKKSEGYSACQALFMHKMFLSGYERSLMNILHIHCGADSALSALQAVLSSQGALRTRYNKESGCFEEYTYCSTWEIPLLDASSYAGDLDLCIASLAESADALGFLQDQMLLSGLLLIKTDAENCLFVSAMHHAIWDGVSQELLCMLINEALENGCDTLRSYSYIQYCQTLGDQGRENDADSEAAEDMKQYAALAQEASALQTCRNSAYRADFRMKLNAAQKDKLARSPIESTMAILADLLYGDCCTRLPLIPFAVLRHNRDEGNGGMLGMTLSVDLALFDVEKKQQIAEMENRGLGSASGEAAMSGFSVPVINYLGIFSASGNGEGDDGEEANADEPYIEIGRSESGIQDVYMEYYVQEDTLNACILGLSLDKDAIEEAISKL
ncbi:MAG: amino acid adenylation domain-containing protein [Clostridiales bacterium]|nr:amino acid adenylation domain-containing protein [Clostridiales bacterium]